MHELILWCGFLGAWLLVAGPVYQAVLELRAEEVAHDRIHAAALAVGRPDPVPAWWWLLPPIAYLAQARRRDRFQQAVAERLSDDDYESLQSFVNKAVGWGMVAGGAFLIAVKETWELAEHHAWPTAVCWAIVVAMALVCLGHAAGRVAHDRSVAERRRATV
jgi:hypothetical protein